MSGGKDEGFLTRWARVKAEAKADPASALPADPPLADPDPRAVVPAADPPGDDPPPDLPDLDSLTAESDFTPFLRQGVPEALKSQALQKLWRSDPVLSAMDALDLHNLDYSHKPLAQVVETAWAVGRGYAEQVLAEPEVDSKPDENEPADDNPPKRTAT